MPAHQRWQPQKKGGSGMETVYLAVTYDPALVTPEFMAEHVFELEGIEAVRVEES